MDLLLKAALGRLQLVHGREVYRDGDNDTCTQLQRVARLEPQRESVRSWHPLLGKFHDFFTAMTSAEACKQPGVDGVVVEMVRALRWPTLLWLYLLFLVRASARLGDTDLRPCKRSCWWPSPTNLTRWDFVR